MFSHEKLKQRRSELHLTQADIYQPLEVSRKTYSSWENGLAEPHAKNLRRLAKRLKVPESYFVDENSALYTYPLLTPPHQKEVDQLASQLLDRQHKVTALTAYQVLSIELAAGLGHTYYDNETDYETVYFDQDIQHDFASWVAGDSMEPKYPNGSVALMKQTGFDYDGAVYALLWNGKTYIKKVYRETEGLRLESINPDYDDLFAPYEDQPQIVGIVVGHFLPIEV
ncbi:helix-turn-helix domain-containing protein [Streptococcus panodentis]|uniref:DNA-binding protein n=1 Tax=Streptococcus panodentis TaxID=1581472 RepID=A0ABS5AY70_9STRE|nr:XRE family transcriptional regulator [Streptococcus panodentis]MBP2621532.1 DNA-binding protein [Streptococcus panodentis]